MSYKIIKEASMLFDDSRVAVIPLDSDFKPLSSEGEIYTSLYKVSYGECKRAYLNAKNPKKVFMYPIGKRKSVVYLVDVNLKSEYFNEISYVISKLCNDGNSISVLCSGLPEPFMDKLYSSLPFSVRLYDNVFAI